MLGLTAMIPSKGKLIAIAVVGIALVVGFFYVKAIKEENERLVLENTLKQAEVVSYQERIEDAQRFNDTLAGLNRKQAEDTKELANKFDRDLERIAIKKPGLLETRINKATQKVFDDFEELTNR